MSTALFEALHADPWAEALVDLQSLNAHVSDAIADGILHVRKTARSEPQSLRSTSIVVLGPPGAGKTHLFARLRRRLGARAVFVHVRPLVHAEITPRFLLGEVVRQLGYATHGVPQVNALVGSLLAHLNGSDAFFPRTFLEEFEALSEEERSERLETALEAVLSIWQEADESYLRRLLQVPFTKGAMHRSLLAWLSGRDCDVSQLARIGATASLDEGLATGALRTLSAVAALAAPIVIVFDQLENLVDASGNFARLLGYANLTSELVDAMRGLVLVHMALDTEWGRGIEPAFNLSQRSRILMRRETLNLPSAKEREELLRLWLERVPNACPFPWPFNDRRLSELCQTPGMTPRMLLMECRRALDSAHSQSAAANDVIRLDENEDLDGSEELDLAIVKEWEDSLSAARATIDEAAEQRVCLDAARLADGLLACGHFVDGGSTLGKAKSTTAGQLVFERDASSLRVAFLSQRTPRSLAAALSKLQALCDKERIIVIREQAWDLPSTWNETIAKQRALVASGRARWISLDREDAARLLALDALLQSARSGEVSDAHGKPMSFDAVRTWVSSRLDIENWRILRDVLDTATQESELESSDKQLVFPRSQANSALPLALLRKLRVASLDRLVREVMRVDPSATRASIQTSLAQESDQVRWFGRAILCVRVP